MPVNLKHIEEYFFPNYTPNWQCPTCHTGILTGNKASFNKVLDSASQKVQDAEKVDYASWEDGLTGVFSGMLTCSNPRCLEKVAVVGKTINKEVGNDEPDERYYIETAFVPLFFTPGLILVKLNDEVPTNIVKALSKAFELFWADSSSCGNKMRVVIELLMDAQDVPSMPSLHSRIEYYKTAQPILADMLMAVKWLGNHGSHGEDSLNRSDLKTAVEIIEAVLNTIYKPDHTDLIASSAAINNARGPVK